MSYVEPGERSFFKYMTPDTALAVLENQTFKYSSPIHFNDPFDIQTSLNFDFDVSKLDEIIIDKLGELARSDEKIQLSEDHPLRQTAELCRKHFPTHGFPRDKWVGNMQFVHTELGSEMEKSRIAIAQSWKEMLPKLRVFCVSEERDNLLMWAHYGKEHTGAMMELRSMPKEDNPLSVAQPVTYSADPPSFFSKQEWVDSFFNDTDMDTMAMFRRYAQTKSDHWAYEKEWRVWYPSENHKDAAYSFTNIRQNEIANVYLGCNASEGFILTTKELIKKHFPHAGIYVARKSTIKYGLTYAAI